LFLLADQGLENELAFREKRQAELELQQRDALERQQKQKEAIQLVGLYMDALSARLQEEGADPNTAPFKAFADIALAKTLAKTIAGAFFDGTEDTGGRGDVDNKGGKLAIIHPHERIMTAEQNARIGVISNDHAADVLSAYGAGDLIETPKYLFGEAGSKATGAVLANNIIIQQNEDIKTLLVKANNRPVQHVNVDSMNNLQETIYENGQKTVITHLNRKRHKFG